MKRVLWIGGLTIAAIGISAAFDPVPRLIWNASASVPVGLYAVSPLGEPGIGDLVLTAPPPALANLLSSRRYLAPGLPILKHVAALPGQRVCRIGEAVMIDGTRAAIALARDPVGRPLPVWSGCRVLQPGRVFLLNADSPTSVDSRYVGPLPRSSLLGRAVAIWTEVP